MSIDLTHKRTSKELETAKEIKEKNMNRLVNFLQDDLKEISHSFQNITETINCTINVEDESILAKDIERLETFISYWQQHAKSLEEA